MDNLNAIMLAECLDDRELSDWLEGWSLLTDKQRKQDLETKYIIEHWVYILDTQVVFDNEIYCYYCEDTGEPPEINHQLRPREFLEYLNTYI